MISIVLYGRNDSYGYNLHKRAALALNCMAEVLTDPADEILFVDYNTPDDFPTFPEAIADTLTRHASERLRILRVRPTVHARVKDATHLVAIEPIARNVAVRRSNPENRWILSTNTDMIFVPRTAASLSDIAATLEPGYYHLPRFEIPESVWEGFDRRDPAAVIARVEALGRTMFLNEIVYGAESIKYDAPGDFQLILRDDLFRIHGFDEQMLLGWHVDSNVAKRLFLIYGVVGDVVDRIFGYHCDHTRQVTPMHRHKAPSNDLQRFIADVQQPDLPGQSLSWGCPDDEIEELRLTESASRVYVRALGSVLDGEWDHPVEARYTPDSFGETAYDPRHVLPFLMDLFVSLPRGVTVGWIGARADTFGMFAHAWRALGFGGQLLVDAWSAPLLLPGETPGVEVSGRRGIADAADVLVFDFGPPSDSPESLGRVPANPDALDAAGDRLLREAFHELLETERARVKAGAAPRRVRCLDAVHNPYEWIVQREIGAASTPFAARLRHGYVTTESTQDRWSASPSIEFLDVMTVGLAGARSDSGVAAPPGRRGYLVTGPNEEFPPGDYEVTFSFALQGPLVMAGMLRRVVAEVVAGSECLVQERINPLARRVTLAFTVSRDCADRRGVVEFRILRGRMIQFALTSVRVRQVGVLPARLHGDDRGRLLEMVTRHPADPAQRATETVDAAGMHT
jgi:hypothetical protein